MASDAVLQRIAHINLNKSNHSAAGKALETISMEMVCGFTLAAVRREKLRGKRGRIRRTVMFIKLRSPPSHPQRTCADANTATVEFDSHAAAIASVNQYGHTNKINKHGTVVRHPRRILLGFSPDDRQVVRDVPMTT